MKGIIAEISGKSAVVLTQTGQFKKVKATSDMIVGKEIDLSRPVGNNGMTNTVMKVTSLAAAGLLVLGIGLGAYSYTLPYSYVHVDINPSIELTVNIYDRIIKAEALNLDGEELLNNNDLKNIKVNAGVTQLLNTAMQQGYLNNTSVQSVSVPGQLAELPDQPVGTPATPNDAPAKSNPDEPDSIGDKPETTPDKPVKKDPKATKIANAVLVTVSSNDSRKSDVLKKELADAVSVELDKDQVTSEILVAKTSIEQRNDAREYGVTPGKLVLIEDAMEGKPATDMDKLKKTAIKDLLEMAADKKRDAEKLMKKIQKEAEEKNKEMTQEKKAEDKVEAQRKKAEAERKKAEDRVEEQRKKAEAERKKAEDRVEEQRKKAETEGKRVEDKAEAQRKKTEIERKKAEDKAEAQRKKAEADRKKAEEKAEAQRKKAEAERKKAEEKRDASKNDYSIYTDTWDKWKTDNKSDKNNQAQFGSQGDTGDQGKKNEKFGPGDKNNVKGKTDTKDYWNQWDANRKTSQELKDEREKLKKEILDQINEKLEKHNVKHKGQDSQHNNDKELWNWW